MNAMTERDSSRLFLICGAAFAFLAVAVGAFGAHALKASIEAKFFEIFLVGARYHFYHALALLALGLLMKQFPGKTLNLAGWAFILGIFLFSGSLYALALTGITKLGMITPVGGLSFLCGWALLVITLLKTRPIKQS